MKNSKQGIIVTASLPIRPAILSLNYHVNRVDVAMPENIKIIHLRAGKYTFTQADGDWFTVLSYPRHDKDGPIPTILDVDVNGSSKKIKLPCYRKNNPIIPLIDLTAGQRREITIPKGGYLVLLLEP